MDSNGYPDDTEIETIRTWATDYNALMEYVRELWKYAKEGFWTKTIDDEGDITYVIATGGWSGNESIIEALEENMMFWLMTWQMSRRGGQFTFVVNKGA